MDYYCKRPIKHNKKRWNSYICAMYLCTDNTCYIRSYILNWHCEQRKKSCYITRVYLYFKYRYNVCIQRYISYSQSVHLIKYTYCNLLLVNVYTLTYKCIHLLKHFEYDIHLLNVQRCMKIMHMTIDCVMYVLYICTAYV